jgi:hypothetical protein
MQTGEPDYLGPHGEGRASIQPYHFKEFVVNRALKHLGTLSGCAALAVVIAHVAHSAAETSHDKYAVKVPGGLAFSEFRGYEGWQVVSVSQNNGKLAVILGNPEMIDAFKSGVPQNGKPFPDGAKMAKVHWIPKKSDNFPSATVPGTQHDVDFMEKDSKRFTDGAGWGWAAFDYDAASDTFRPATVSDNPPQANDAKCGLGCHTIVKARDYVFTEYGKR